MYLKYYVTIFNLFKLMEAGYIENEFTIESKFCEDLLINMTVNIINSCFKKVENNIIFSHPMKNEEFFLKFLVLNQLPMYVVESEKSLNKTTLQRKYRTVLKSNLENIPGHNFVVFTYSHHDFLYNLDAYMKSTWWNHEGLFIVINTEKAGCRVADLLLKSIWQANVLSAIVLCMDADDGIKMYTFNPFNEFAPKFWTTKKVLQVEHPHWTFLEKKLTASDTLGPDLCENLNFEKTKNLNGYNINMGAYVHSYLLLFNANKTGIDRFGGVNGDITRTVCNYLNATANVTFYSEMGTVDDNGYFQGFLKDLQAGSIDYAMNMNIQRRLWKQQTYPHETSGFCIISLKYPITFMEKFNLLLTPGFWFTLGITCLTTILILKVCLKHSLLLAILNLLKLILVPSSLKECPWSFTQRIFFLECLILTMITSIIFQSYLSSINVGPNTHPTIDTIEDLMNSDVTIYSTLNYKDLFLDPKISSRYKVGDYPTCIKKLLKEENVACISGCIEARYHAYESRVLHISNNNELREFYMVFPVRKNWPLISIFNKIIRRLGETGIIHLFRKRELRFFKHSSQHPDSVYFDPITFKNLKYSLVILALGLFVSACVFIIEISMRFIKNLKMLMFPKRKQTRKKHLLHILRDYSDFTVSFNR